MKSAAEKIIETSREAYEPAERKPMQDIFEPKHDPARAIYLAFQDEAKKRKGRQIGEWVAAERETVFRECVTQAQKHELRAPSMDEVIAAERYAMGSIDYGAKWAYRLVNVMQRQNRESALVDVGGRGM